MNLPITMLVEIKGASSKMMGRLFEAKRSTKRIVSSIYDIFAISFSLYAAICLRYGSFRFTIESPEVFSLVITLVASLTVFIRLGLYRAILRFMAHQALVSVVIGVSISGSVFAASSFFLQASIPRSVPIIYVFTALFFIGVPRLIVRSAISFTNNEQARIRKAVVIYGAGSSGYQLATSLQGSNYKVVAFLDDNKKLKGTLVHGRPVLRPKELQSLVSKYSLSEIFLALGNTQRSRRSEIIRQLEPLEISVKTIPPINDILSGKSRVEDIKDVEIEDLLGRDPVQPNPKLLDACIKTKNVLVTGAGGSIGSELCRQIIKLQPRQLILVELNEYSLYKIEQELQSELQKIAFRIEVVTLIGSIQSKAFMKSIFCKYKINTVYHAAAYKHVPIVEKNIVEGARNNILGTWYCAEAAITSKVDSFVLISTDKAVRPTSIMGVTKRVAELTLQGLANRNTSTRFTIVRFGNVLGSSGSVVPLFREQIKNGGPVTVTHPEIIRYFMTIPEAAELVIQAGSMGSGGDVFVLDMGKPVKIIDLATRMVHLSGLTLKDEKTPDGDIKISFTGLRQGEKLYEELLIGGNTFGTEHSRILKAREKSMPWNETQETLTKLLLACNEHESNKVKDLLLEAPTDFSSDLACDRKENIDLKLIFNQAKI